MDSKCFTIFKSGYGPWESNDHTWDHFYIIKFYDSEWFFTYFIPVTDFLTERAIRWRWKYNVKSKIDGGWGHYAPGPR